jgi:AcrR family transcriptional regulator
MGEGKDRSVIVPNDTTGSSKRLMTTHSPTTSDSAPNVDPRIERSRAAVNEAAAALVLAEGPDAITHGRVAAAAGVSRTTVYKHYPERSDLLFATVQAIGKSTPESVDITGNLRADLRTFLGHLATDLRDDGHAKLMAMMMERAMHDEAVALVRDTFMAEITATFEELIGRGIASGELRNDVDVPLSLASVAGSMIYSRFLADVPIDDDRVDAVIENFITTNAPR